MKEESMSKAVSIRFVGLMAVLILVAAGFSILSAAAKQKSTLRMTSTSFQNGLMIPDKYTCKGANVSPEIQWKGAPEKTKCFALVCEDPDAPLQTWVQWVIYNIPVKDNITKSAYLLLEGFPRDEKLTNGIMQGANDFKKIGYDGPCPPSGIHRYYFELYALDSFLNVSAGISKTQLLRAMKGHILAQTQIMGKYGSIK
jgi:Raf kinase inhibitor-like YbhB/YbcL family protein